MSQPIAPDDRTRVHAVADIRLRRTAERVVAEKRAPNFYDFICIAKNCDANRDNPNAEICKCDLYRETTS